jgi:sulfoquinovosyltransferase
MRLTCACVHAVIAAGKGVSVPGSNNSAYVDQPQEFHGAKVISAMSFPCPWYWPLPLSFGLSPRIYKAVK